MNQPIQLEKGDHFFFQHYDNAIRAKVEGFEVYETIDSKPAIWDVQPNKPVYVWRYVVQLLEDIEPVFSKGQTLCVTQHSVIGKVPVAQEKQ